MSRRPGTALLLAALAAGVACARQDGVERAAAPSPPSAPAAAGAPASPASAANPAPAPDDSRGAEPGAWRERARGPASLSPGELVRVAKRQSHEEAAPSCPPPPSPPRAARSAAPAACPPAGDAVEGVEIDWHAPAPAP